MIEFEQMLWDSGMGYIAGIDEVGRGALAGPLVAAAVILNKNHLTKLTQVVNNDIINTNAMKSYNQIKDSKLLTPKKRTELDKFIREVCVCYSIQLIEVDKVDAYGMTKATQMVFQNCVTNLAIKPHHLLIDCFGLKTWKPEKQTALPKGDNKSISIAAASIIAKVFRDNLMIEMHKVYGNYGFDKHKGYGTKLHMEALKTYGPCEQHRKSFKPIKEFV